MLGEDPRAVGSLLSLYGVPLAMIVIVIMTVLTGL